MKVLAPLLGPLIGHSTPDRITLWARVSEANRPEAWLVARRFDNGVPVAFVSSPFRVWHPVPAGADPEAVNPYAGAGVLHMPMDLNDPAEIDYQLGWTDNPPPADGGGLDWADLPVHRLKRPDVVNRVSFLLGSCRHGGQYHHPDEDAQIPQQSDVAFAGICEHHLQEIDFSLMVGDQVYADLEDGAIFGPNRGATTLPQYFAKYARAFAQQNFARLIASRPNYMILDDHELWNDYDPFSDNPAHNDRARFQAAIRSYVAHQALHSPLAPPTTPSPPLPDRYHYTFAQGPFRFFVLDVRTERNGHAQPAPSMISPAQEAALMTWISNNRDHPFPKFIVSSLPMGPDTIGGRKEKWSGFGEQRKRILDALQAEDRFVFLSGDVHTSFVVGLRRGNETQPVAYNIFSSGFYWPQLGMQRWMFRWSCPLVTSLDDESGGADGPAYRTEFLGPDLMRIPVGPDIVKRHNYAIVDASPDEVTVRFFKSKNARQIGTTTRIRWDF